MVGLAFAYLGLQRGQHHHDLPVGRAGGGHGHQRAALAAWRPPSCPFCIFNFFFTVPLFTLHFSDKSYLATFLVMFLVAFLSRPPLTTRIKRQARLTSPAGLPHPGASGGQPDPPEGGGAGRPFWRPWRYNCASCWSDGPVLPGAARRHPGPAPVLPRGAHRGHQAHT
ncbi:MAG: DUF4118 domain-containing protein [Oscillospiraceae bacterium]